MADRETAGDVLNGHKSPVEKALQIAEELKRASQEGENLVDLQKELKDAERLIPKNQMREYTNRALKILENR